MSNDHPSLPQPYRVSTRPNEFFVYRCSNPATECEYEYLAINYERSIFLSLGAHSVCFDFDITEEVERWRKSRLRSYRGVHQPRYYGSTGLHCASLSRGR